MDEPRAGTAPDGEAVVFPASFMPGVDKEKLYISVSFFLISFFFIPNEAFSPWVRQVT